MTSQRLISHRFMYENSFMFCTNCSKTSVSSRKHWLEPNHKIPIVENPVFRRHKSNVQSSLYLHISPISLIREAVKKGIDKMIKVIKYIIF